VEPSTSSVVERGWKLQAEVMDEVMDEVSADVWIITESAADF
jgi:hypothetical protein